MMSVLFLCASIGTAAANPDIYSALPDDTKVVKYAMGDADGDGVEEIGILYRTGQTTNLTFFHSENDRWIRWWDYTAKMGKSGPGLYSFEITDATGDGSMEVIVNLVSPDRDVMISRVMEYAEGDAGASFKLLLEDSTRPAGYPLLGSFNGKPSITFLDLGDDSQPGHRRVYCWDGSSFEKCVELPFGVVKKSSPRSQVPSPGSR